MLFPDEIAQARAECESRGEARGIKQATERFIHRFGNQLSEEQIRQLQEEGNPMVPK